MSSSTPLIQQKAALRRTLKERRAGLADPEAAAEAIARHLVAGVDLPPSGVVAGHWPLAGELDPRPAMRRLGASGHALALPRMRGAGEPLAFHVWREGDALIRAAFGVMEPDPSRPQVEPDLLLVPLLAFDAGGRRLGWGKGYYDRTLARLRTRRPEVLAIGVAFAAQQVDQVPAGPADQALDLVVTELGLVRVGAAP